MDVCGGPGAFSQYLLSKEKENFPCKGYGITLITSESVLGEIWYEGKNSKGNQVLIFPDLKKKNFRALYGKDSMC